MHAHLSTLSNLVSCPDLFQKNREGSGHVTNSNPVSRYPPGQVGVGELERKLYPTRITLKLLTSQMVCSCDWSWAGHVTGHVTDHVAGHVTDRVTGHVTDRVTGHVTDHVACHVTDVWLII